MQLNQKTLEKNLIKKDLPELGQILRGFSSSEQLPAYLRIQLLDFCNLKCFFCHNEGTEIKYRKIDEEIMWKAVRASASLSKFKIGFTGGEPTLHPNFSEYLIKLKQEIPKAQIVLTTNGTTLLNLPEEIFEGCINKINISVHSLDKKKYTEIMGADRLDVVLKGLERIADFKLKKVINLVVGKQNLNEIGDFVDYFKGKGFEIKILHILGFHQNSVAVNEIDKAVDIVKEGGIEEGLLSLKGFNRYQKCTKCKFVPVCGEGEYLRLGVDNVLSPCLYRKDLHQEINAYDSMEVVVRKMALGFRRIWFDDV